jgi:hypothetical protein
MKEQEMERRLSGFDFSTLSPVREPLLQKLLGLRRSQELLAQANKDLWTQRIDDEMLDEVAAAGNPVPSKKPEGDK